MKIDPYIRTKGEHAGEPAASLESTLVHIGLIKIDGTQVYPTSQAQAEAPPAEDASASEADDAIDTATEPAEREPRRKSRSRSRHWLLRSDPARPLTGPCRFSSPRTPRPQDACLRISSPSSAWSHGHAVVEFQRRSAMSLVSRFAPQSPILRSDRPLGRPHSCRRSVDLRRRSHGSRSDRYAYIPTSTVLTKLRQEGFGALHGVSDARAQRRPARVHEAPHPTSPCKPDQRRRGERDHPAQQP